MKKEIAVTVERVDLIVIGAGPAGLTAAIEISRRGGQVIVLDEGLIPGGRLAGQIHQEPKRFFRTRPGWVNGAQKAKRLSGEAIHAGVKIICGASVWTVSSGWFVGVTPTNPAQKEDRLPTGFEAQSVLIATGAAQNPLPLPGWTLPGVITAGAAQTLINVQQVLPGRRVVVIGIDPLAVSVAQLMAAIGVDVKGVLLPPSNGLQYGVTTTREAINVLAHVSHYAPSIFLFLMGKIAGCMAISAARYFPRNGITTGNFPLMLKHRALAIEGVDRVEQIKVAPLMEKGKINPWNTQTWQVDAVVTSAGLYPLTELVQIAGCPLVHVSDLGGWAPLHSAGFKTPVPGLFVAGSITGVEGARVAEAQGRVAGIVAADYLGLEKGSSLENGLVRAQTAVSAARRENVPFLFNIEAGRTYMSQLWEQYFRQRA